MRNGLKLTLMVAIALMGMRASAMVPVINPIPDPIVGDLEGGTGSGEFVFPDALNLDQYGSDPDNGPNASLTWSFEAVDDKYTFNGVGPLGGADPVNPANSIDDQDLDTSEVDGNPLTVTIRNTDLSPLGGPNVEPGAEGILDPNETRVVTLYASDGATAGSREIIVYTDNEGEDRLSFNELFVASGDFNAGPEGWIYGVVANSGGTITSSTNTGALCITVSAAGDNDAYFASPFGLLELTNNSVYIGRFSLDTTQTAPNAVPLINLMIENQGEGAFDGMLAYFGESYFLDAFGGANAPEGQTNGNAQHTMLFTPMAVSTAKWQNGAYDPANDGIKDARVRFRLLDYAVSGFYGADIDSGQVCLDDYMLTKVDIGVFNRVNTAYAKDTLNAADFHLEAVGAATTADFNADPGNVIIRPTDGNWEAEVAVLYSGDGNVDIFGNVGLADDYPVAWESDGMLFEVEMWLSAPDAAAANNPPDVIRLGLDAPTNEFIGMNWMTPAGGALAPQNLGTPSTGEPQQYRGFFAPNDTTLADEGENAIGDADGLRVRFDVLCDPNIGFNSFNLSPGTNAGGVKVHEINVYEVTY